MKNWNPCAIIFLILICVSFSCGNKTEHQETPEEIDNPNLREETGGAPDETTTLVSGSFKSSEKKCKSGFGLCQLEFINPTANYPDSTKENTSEKKYKAI